MKRNATGASALRIGRRERVLRAEGETETREGTSNALRENSAENCQWDLGHLLFAGLLRSVT